MRFTDVASCNFTLCRGMTGHVDVRGKVGWKITESRGIDHYSKIGRGDFDLQHGEEHLKAVTNMASYSGK